MSKSENELVSRYKDLVSRIGSTLPSFDSRPVLHYLPEHPHAARVELVNLLMEKGRAVRVFTEFLDQAGSPNNVQAMLIGAGNITAVGQLIVDLDALILDAGGHFALRDKVLAATA
jgi:hypothetical protein